MLQTNYREIPSADWISLLWARDFESFHANRTSVMAAHRAARHHTGYSTAVTRNSQARLSSLQIAHCLIIQWNLIFPMSVSPKKWICSFFCPLFFTRERHCPPMDYWISYHLLQHLWPSKTSFFFFLLCKDSSINVAENSDVAEESHIFLSWKGRQKIIWYMCM